MMKTLMTAAAVLALLMGACGGGDSLAGAHDCGPDEPVTGFPQVSRERITFTPVETWELREDGTFVIQPGPPPGEAAPEEAGAPEPPPPGEEPLPPGPPEGAWSVEGDSLIVTFDGQEEALPPGLVGPKRFTIQGDGFRSEPGEWPVPPGEEARWVCTRAT